MTIQSAEDLQEFKRKLDKYLREAVLVLEQPQKELSTVFGAVVQNIQEEGDIPDLYFDVVGAMMIANAAEIARLREDVKKLTNLIENVL